jgi:hypothetical protein
MTANGEHNRTGEAVSELLPRLSADAGKSKQMGSSLFHVGNNQAHRQL